LALLPDRTPKIGYTRSGDQAPVIRTRTCFSRRLRTPA
jgi:hypothetical protein